MEHFRETVYPCFSIAANLNIEEKLAFSVFRLHWIPIYEKKRLQILTKESRQLANIFRMTSRRLQHDQHLLY